MIENAFDSSDPESCCIRTELLCISTVVQMTRSDKTRWGRRGELLTETPRSRSSQSARPNWSFLPGASGFHRFYWVLPSVSVLLSRRGIIIFFLCFSFSRATSFSIYFLSTFIYHSFFSRQYTKCDNSQWPPLLGPSPGPSPAPTSAPLLAALASPSLPRPSALLAAVATPPKPMLASPTAVCSGVSVVSLPVVLHTTSTAAAISRPRLLVLSSQHRKTTRRFTTRLLVFWLRRMTTMMAATDL